MAIGKREKHIAADASDEDLVKLCKKGNTQAFEVLYHRYQRMVMGLCLRYSGSHAEDMLQECFIRAWKKIGSYKAKGAFGGWLRTLCVRHLLNSKRTEPTDEAPSTWGSYVPDDYRSLLTHIYSLPKGYRTVFCLYAIDGYSHKEIAQMLNIKEGTSHSQYAKAKALLQTQLADER